MSESKHTPEPWERTCTPFGLLGVASVATGERIAMMKEHKDDPKYGESYANAGMMAASPELLAFAERIEQLHYGGINKSIRAQCLAVIAKAKGE